MPIYEYQCTNCQSGFELLIRGDEKAACPECDSKQVEKQLSIAAAPRGGSLPIAGSSSLPAAPLGGG